MIKKPMKAPMKSAGNMEKKMGRGMAKVAAQKMSVPMKSGGMAKYKSGGMTKKGKC